jgi:hypothetical protein
MMERYEQKLIKIGVVVQFCTRNGGHIPLNNGNHAQHPARGNPERQAGQNGCTGEIR